MKNHTIVNKHYVFHHHNNFIGKDKCLHLIIYELQYPGRISN